ncbi:hypothetical protein L9F63_007729, partial [Diploptera punctata]
FLSQPAHWNSTCLGTSFPLWKFADENAHRFYQTQPQDYPERSLTFFGIISISKAMIFERIENQAINFMFPYVSFISAACATVYEQSTLIWLVLMPKNITLHIISLNTALHIRPPFKIVSLLLLPMPLSFRLTLIGTIIA